MKKKSSVSLRHRALCGWLSQNEPNTYEKALKVQKFLFLYELFSVLEEDNEVDVKYLKGYKNGPVFSEVYGAYTYGKEDFNKYLPKAYGRYSSKLDEDRLQLSSFVVKILEEKELSKFSHQFNLWSAKKKEINRYNSKQVPLNMEDFSEEDKCILRDLKDMYSVDFIKSIETYKIGAKTFIFSKEDYKKLTKQHYDTLLILSKKKELINPVYIEIEDGVLCVD